VSTATRPDAETGTGVIDRESADDGLAGVLGAVASGQLGVAEGVAALRHLPFRDLGFARVDHHRWLRQGLPEFVYGPGKTDQQLRSIVLDLLEVDGPSVIITRLDETRSAPLRDLALQRGLPFEWHPGPGLLAILRSIRVTRGEVLVLAAGTADLDVATEAEATARLLGASTRLIVDVGVAGIHRLLAELPALDAADAIVVVAGMEGALASVVGGLAAVPVIACPTSVGYGANLGGITALLAMMASCTPGVAVVNVDDGIGAGTIAAMTARGRDR
jgi:NCAIR mutase (PurE)-related protein